MRAAYCGAVASVQEPAGEALSLVRWTSRVSARDTVSSSRDQDGDTVSSSLQVASRYGAPGRIRTSDRRLRRPMLYPAELQARGRGERIRTFDILLPKQARYQAALHPEGHGR